MTVGEGTARAPEQAGRPTGRVHPQAMPNRAITVGHGPAVRPPAARPGGSEPARPARARATNPNTPNPGHHLLSHTTYPHLTSQPSRTTLRLSLFLARYSVPLRSVPLSERVGDLRDLPLQGCRWLKQGERPTGVPVRKHPPDGSQAQPPTTPRTPVGT